MVRTPPPHSMTPLQAPHEPPLAPPRSTPGSLERKAFPLGEEKEKKKEREGNGVPAKAFSLRSPERDAAKRRINNLNATAAHTTTRMRETGVPVLEEDIVRSDFEREE
ncbi:hypothetical protein Taro_045707 [Colocasia esculenta]|uniref:Uncharacterized protein n=1 Tax=Colocasia esculenta TaxID=4460 RepID=A0A843X0S2_COLES|nr:hypothetical protein [Colocasia esculenta]